MYITTKSCSCVQSLSGVWLLATPGLKHTRLPCPSLCPGVCTNVCSLSWWCYLTISSSVARFSSCPQSFPPSGSFPMSQLFASGGRSIEASAWVLSMNIQNWFLLGLTGLISLLSKGLSRVFSNTTVQEHQFLVLSLLYDPSLTLTHNYWEDPWLGLDGPLSAKWRVCFLIYCVGLS